MTETFRPRNLDKIEEDILEAIAVNSIFGFNEIYKNYNLFKSYDLLVSACALCSKIGYSNLEIACILVIGKND